MRRARIVLELFVLVSVGLVAGRAGARPRSAVEVLTTRPPTILSPRRCSEPWCAVGTLPGARP